METFYYSTEGSARIPITINLAMPTTTDTQPKRERVPNDYYPTPAPITEILLWNVPQLPELVFEPCCGQKAISDVLVASGKDVFSRDITFEDDQPKDATTKEFWDYWLASLRTCPSVDCRNWATVTNPPFNVASKILPLAYEYSPWGVAFLLRLSYLEPTADRAEWLKKHADNLRYLIPVNPRPKMRADTKATDSVTLAWFVWQRSWSWQQMGIRSPFQFENGWKEK